MSRIQRLILTFLPERLAKEMEADSRRWMLTCQTCGLERSIWDIGGIRWKASGNPSRMLDCPNCNQQRMHSLSRKP